MHLGCTQKMRLVAANVLIQFGFWCSVTLVFLAAIAPKG